MPVVSAVAAAMHGHDDEPAPAAAPRARIQDVPAPDHDVCSATSTDAATGYVQILTSPCSMTRTLTVVASCEKGASSGASGGGFSFSFD